MMGTGPAAKLRAIRLPGDAWSRSLIPVDDVLAMADHYPLPESFTAQLNAAERAAVAELTR